ncbi:hypothetical protein DFJ77DRAFT_449883 [Powellomyces hirtus]|nr:hypothetical protein DFJ77DRAFT_449883 [Powellomyces hirtus]
MRQPKHDATKHDETYQNASVLNTRCWDSLCVGRLHFFSFFFLFPSSSSKSLWAFVSPRFPPSRALSLFPCVSPLFIFVFFFHRSRYNSRHGSSLA